jgi:hypothetical protein
MKRSIEATSSSRLAVGICTGEAVAPNSTMPMRTSLGTSRTKDLAADWAALSRVGSTSVARMLPDVSMASTIVLYCAGRVIVALGRAMASTSTTSASSSSNGGT